jgi:hypothetical protein
MPLQGVQGKVAQLRANELDTGFGPPSDFIDVEAVVLLNGRDGGLGFQLRNDENLAVRQAMFDLLRDAFNTQTMVAIDYDITDKATNGVIVRVTLIR